MKKIVSRIFLIAVTLGVFIPVRTGANRRAAKPLPSEQLIIVVSKNWDTLVAQLYAFEKKKESWQLQFSFPVVLGQKGMAMGEGMREVQVAGAPQKKEGDMKSPAGIFYLGPAFGYAGKSSTQWIHFPYLHATDTLLCIDDPHSVQYNKLVSTDSTEADWRSHEEMHRKDLDYKWGIFIQHNFHPVRKFMGSCIFFHIWEGAGEGTAGCTAMEEKNMLKLLKWIRADKRPLLVQFPDIVYKKVRGNYLLPDL
jgi:L,D-peptidoglycan transpeptidase YkuD (ErfK/YbiS/YcfS/YnhG family)